MLSTNRAGIWTSKNTIFNPFAAIERDPLFDLVSVLIPGTVSADIKGVPTFPDYSNALNAVSAVSSTNMTNVAGKFAPYAINHTNSNTCYLSTPSPVNSSPGSGNFTIRCWAKQTALPWYYSASYPDARSTIAAKYEPAVSPGKEWLFQRLDGGGFSFTGWVNDSTPVTASISYQVAPNVFNVYEHYQVTISSGRIYFFLNGNLLNAGGTAFAVNIQSTAAHLTIGGTTDYPSYTFPGYLDQVEVSRIARNTSSFTLRTSVQPTYKDIQRIYNVQGSYNWLCPIGVTSISVVAVGAGGSYAGAGGNSTMDVGNSINLQANGGQIGLGGVESTNATVSSRGGNSPYNTGDFGGGGAGGYSQGSGTGSGGGLGGGYPSISSSGLAGIGGAGGGGAANNGGGGVGLYGLDTSGAGGVYGSSPAGKGGSGGADGSGLAGGGYGGGSGTTTAINLIGGGGGSLSYRNSATVVPGTTYAIGIGGAPANAGKGGVRIIWPASYNGSTRVFPSTWTQDV